MTIFKKFRFLLALVLVLAVGGMAVSGASVLKAVCYVSDLSDTRALTSTPLYESRDGELIAALAHLPVDVTAEYAGSDLYGIPADATRGYAYRITLRSDVCWENGAAVNGADVVSAIEEQLENYSWLANAESYLSGCKAAGETVVTLAEAGFDSLQAAEAAGYTRFFLDVGQFWGLECGWERLDSRQRLVDNAMPAGLEERYVTPAYLYRNYLAEGTSLSYLQGKFLGVAVTQDSLTLADIGIWESGEFEFVLVTEAPLTAGTLMARLAKLELGGEEGRSCGPYRIVSQDADELTLERNPFWQGEEAISADTIRCVVR